MANMIRWKSCRQRGRTALYRVKKGSNKTNLIVVREWCGALDYVWLPRDEGRFGSGRSSRANKTSLYTTRARWLSIALRVFKINVSFGLSMVCSGFSHLYMILSAIQTAMALEPSVSWSTRFRHQANIYTAKNIKACLLSEHKRGKEYCPPARGDFQMCDMIRPSRVNLKQRAWYFTNTRCKPLRVKANSSSALGRSGPQL